MPILKPIDPQRRFCVIYEPDRLKNQFLLRFYKKWRDSVDPTGIHQVLKKRTSFPSGAKAREFAKATIAKLSQAGASIETLQLTEQAQLLALAAQLKEGGVNPAELIKQAIEIKSKNLSPIAALNYGEEICERIDEHKDKTLGFYIAQYEHDSEAKKNTTHVSVIAHLKFLKGLEKIKVNSLLNPQLARSEIKPILEGYIKGVRRYSSLRTARDRIAQLFSYMRDEIGVPSVEAQREITNLKKYRLSHDLLDEKPDYAFSAAEVLLIFKFFSQKKTCDPLMPVFCILTGCREKQWLEMTWEMIHYRDEDDSYEVRVPYQKTKLGRLGVSKTDVTFDMSVIPNLREWFTWAKNIVEARFNKPTLRTRSRAIANEYKNKMLTQFSHLFGCKSDAGELPLWGNVAHNAMRNTFMTMGLAHPQVKEHVSKLSNDYKSHQRYLDTNVANPAREAAVIFSMTPAWLGLVDLEKGTIDKEFLYADKDKKLEIWARTRTKYDQQCGKDSQDESTKSELLQKVITYQEVLEDLGFTGDQLDWHLDDYQCQLDIPAELQNPTPTMTK